MKDEPEIVKDMRKSENLGKLGRKSKVMNQDMLQQLEIDGEILQNDLDKNEEKSEYSKGWNSGYSKSETQYKTLVENLLEGILILDFKGKILFANPAIAKIFGFKSVEDSIGKKTLELIDPKYRKRIIKDQLSESIGKEDFLDTYKTTTVDGRQIWIECIGTKIEYKDKKANLVFIRDITHRQKTWDDLEKLEEKYIVLAETSSDGILSMDPLGRLIYVNPSFERMCMKDKNEILTTLFREYISNESVYLFQQVFIDSRKMNKRIENVKLDLILDDGNIVPIEINLSPLIKDGKFTGMICTVRNITERSKIENEIRKSERLKTEFMNIAAHELKSPVTPIKGYLDLIISDEEASDRIKNWAKISLRNSERLLKLVGDILDVSRLDSDTMRFEMEKLDPVEILDEIVEDLKPTFKNNNLEFITHIPKKLPNILGDRFRLSQVFRNIIGNAIKFTDNGFILIEAKSEGNYILISVEDTGTGISSHELKKIFAKFYQAYMGNDRNNEGTGLGLFICKEIVEKHNGKIMVESKLKKGSKFLIKLPHL